MGASQPSAGTLQARATKWAGAALLEVVVALALLTAGMATVGLQIQHALRGAERAEQTTRAVMLAESKLAELDAGLLSQEMELAGEFGPAFPGFAWRMTIEPTDTPELNLVTIQITHSESDPATGQPVGEPKVLYTARTFRATPPTVDMERDFGLSAEQVASLSDATSMEGFDPTQFSPSDLQGMSLDELLGMLPTLIEMFGGQGGLDAEAIRQALESGELPEGVGSGKVP